MFKYIFQNVTHISTKEWITPQTPLYYHLKRFLHTYRPLAFYSIVHISSKRIQELQMELQQGLEQLGVVGRIYIAPEEGIGGINCQMAVPLAQVAQVKQYLSTLRDFGEIEYTQGMQDTSSPNFTKLKVLIKKNLVAIKKDLNVQDLQKQQPHHLTPAEWHTELQRDDLFLLDMRNHYEFDVGHFDQAIKLDVDTFRDGIQLLDDLTENKAKQDDIYMYCTGGIRCSVAGAYLSKKGFKNVKMLKGGISAYGHYIKEAQRPSLFKGKNFTFDGRRGEAITNDVLTTCYHCGTSSDTFSNCSNHLCHLLYITCHSCQTSKHTCSSHCTDVVQGKQKYKYDYNYHDQITRGLTSSRVT